MTRSLIYSAVGLVLGACILKPAAAQITVFRCVDINGRVVYSDVHHKGCKTVNLPAPTPMTIDRARANIEERLTDPESARYKSLFQVRRTGAVCGRVNSKNRMGGYDGFKSFVAQEAAGGPEVRFEGEPGFYKAYEDLCSETAPAAR